MFLGAHAVGNGKGFFRTTQENGKYWFVSPGGEKFFSMGIDTILPSDTSPVRDSPVYRGSEIRGGIGPWAARTAERLRAW